MKIIAPLFLFLFFAASCTRSAPQFDEQKKKANLENTLQISKNVHAQILSNSQGFDELEKSLFDFSQNGDELNALAHFVDKVCGIGCFTIIPVASEIGWSGNSVYQIRDQKTNEVKFFLKKFGKGSKSFFSEVFGLDYLQNVSGLAAPKLQAVGKCYHDGNLQVLILETPALGRSFQYYFNQVGGFAAGSAERKAALNTLLQGCRLAGGALAKLHSHLPFKMMAFPERYEKMIQDDLKKAIAKLEAAGEKRVNIAKLQASVDTAIKKMSLEPHRRGLTHGDVKLIHLFYDPSSQQISLINPHHLSASLGPNASLEGMPLSDVYQFSRSLLMNRFGYSLDKEGKVQKQELLTADEAAVLKKAFIQGYLAEGGGILSHAEEEFFLLRHNLLFLANFDRKLPEPDATRLKDLIGISIADIQDRLKRLQ